MSPPSGLRVMTKRSDAATSLPSHRQTAVGSGLHFAWHCNVTMLPSADGMIFGLATKLGAMPSGSGGAVKISD